MNSKTNLRLLFCFIITFTITTAFPAFELSADCSTSGGDTCVGYDLCIPNYAIISGFTVRAQGDTCYSHCDQECQNTYSVLSDGQELNDDVISLCQMFCKSSSTFSSVKRFSTLKGGYSNAVQYFTVKHSEITTPKKQYNYSLYEPNDRFYRHEITSLFNDISSPISFTNQGCTADDLNQAYDTKLKVKSGSEITITLVTPGDNTVTLCGHDIRKVDPYFNSFSWYTMIP